MGITGGKKRQSLRLRDNDYTSEGAYFITLVTHFRDTLFGCVINGEVELSSFGEIARNEWYSSAGIREELDLFDNEFVIMPNHVHGIVWILKNGVGATGRSPLHSELNTMIGLTSRSLGAFVAGYKSSVTRKINMLRETPGKPVWLRNYHDRVIRNECELKEIRGYIASNPLKWELDQYYID